MKTTSAIAVAAFAVTIPLLAGSPDFEAPLSPTPPPASGWEFEFALYAPVMGLDGKTGIGPVIADLDISFSEILDNLDAALSGAFAARHDRWSITGDLIWLKVSDATFPAANSYLGLKLEQYMGSLTLGYEFYANDRTSLEIIGGAAVTSIDVDLDLFTPRLPVAVRNASGSETWVDPIVGFRIRHQLAERWSVFASGVCGGFGGSSDEYWQALGGVGYRLTDHSSLALVYRVISMDYRNGGFLFDAKASGPNLGLVFHF